MSLSEEDKTNIKSLIKALKPIWDRVLCCCSKRNHYCQQKETVLLTYLNEALSNPESAYYDDWKLTVAKVFVELYKTPLAWRLEDKTKEVYDRTNGYIKKGFIEYTCATRLYNNEEALMYALKEFFPKKVSTGSVQTYESLLQSSPLPSRKVKHNIQAQVDFKRQIDSLIAALESNVENVEISMESRNQLNSKRTDLG